MSLITYFIEGYRSSNKKATVQYPKVIASRNLKKKRSIPKGNLSIRGDGEINSSPTPDFSAQEIEETFKKELGITLSCIGYLVGGATETHALHIPHNSFKSVVNPNVIDELVLKMGLDNEPTITHRKSNWKTNKNVIEITFTRKKKQIQHLGDYLNSFDFWDTEGSLVTPIGKSSKPLFLDLAKMVHISVTGMTGSGKSEFLNNIIFAIHHRYSKEEVKFAFIDPKILEFPIYKESPLIMDWYYRGDDENGELENAFFDNMEKATDFLAYLVSLMDRRYRKLAASRVQNIQQYNKKASEKMPYIICVIDELASFLLRGDYQRIESSIMELTQKARTAGIILILATQTAANTVKTKSGEKSIGHIYANIPTKFHFKAGSKSEAQNVLKIPEAYYLSGQGDGIMSRDGKTTRFTSVYLDPSINDRDKIAYWQKEMSNEL